MYSIGLDLGSSSVKAAIIDVDTLEVKASVKYPEHEMAISSPIKDWAEQDPEQWWDSVVTAIRRAIHDADIDVRSIRSIGVAYQMHGLVCIDREGKVLRPSIIWCDSRAIQDGITIEGKMPSAVVTSKLYNHVGNFTAAKLHWVKENEPHIFAQIDTVMLPGDYIAYRMSGHRATTYSGLSEGIWYDFETKDLSQDMLVAVGVRSEIMPEIGHSFDVLGRTDEAFQVLTGIASGTPISYRAGDQPNNAFALGVVRDGEIAATGGTSGVVYAVSDKIRFDPLARINSFVHVTDSQQDMAIGNLLCINGTGIMYNWVRSNFFPDHSYDQLEKIAAQVPIGSGGVSILPFGNGAERMLINKVFDASIHGLDFNRHTKEHLLRATLEGIAFGFVWGMEAMINIGLDLGHIKAGNDNLFQSSVFSRTLSSLTQSRIEICHTTGAIGAARGAAYGAGLIPSLDKAISGIETVATIEPDVDREPYIHAYNRWRELTTDQLTKLSAS
jgi:xylulokinase